jgi:hypothetical protein
MTYGAFFLGVSGAQPRMPVLCVGGIDTVDHIACRADGTLARLTLLAGWVAEGALAGLVLRTRALATIDQVVFATT